LTVQAAFFLLEVHLRGVIMFEAIVALLIVLSFGVFAAHAVDAIRS